MKSSAFLTSANIVNLFVQATFFILLGMAELYALILSEIDLSVGFVGAVGAAIALALIGAPQNWPWWAGIIVGMAACAVIGAFQGLIITKLKIPSFVVTLAGLLGWQRRPHLRLRRRQGRRRRGDHGLQQRHRRPRERQHDAGGRVDPAHRDRRPLRLDRYPAHDTTPGSGAERAPSLSITLLTVAAVAVAGVVLVYICNLNRGVVTAVKGVPWVIPVVLLILVAQSFLMARTRLGRYIYAIGASPEAARRAGIKVDRIRTIAFALCSLTAGLAAVVYASRLGSISVGFDGGTYVLYAVAAAVIGGASLFGGYGKPIHPLLGGLVIATLTNGLALLNISTAGTDIATAVVLIVAVAVDATLRRRGRTGAGG